MKKLVFVTLLLFSSIGYSSASETRVMFDALISGSVANVAGAAPLAAILANCRQMDAADEVKNYMRFHWAFVSTGNFYNISENLSAFGIAYCKLRKQDPEDAARALRKEFDALMSVGLYNTPFLLEAAAHNVNY
jgi:hypothetical protein